MSIEYINNLDTGASVRVITPPVDTNSSLIIDERYDEAYNIEDKDLDVYDNYMESSSVWGTGPLYRVKVNGVEEQEYNGRNYTPIISITEYENVNTKEKGWLLIKCFYFLRYESNYFSFVKLCYCIMSKSLSDIEFLRDEVFGLNLKSGGSLLDYNPRLNPNTVGIYTNYTSTLYNLFTARARYSQSTNKRLVLDSLIAQNTFVHNTQFIVKNLSTGRNYLAGCDLLFNPQIQINEADWTALGGSRMGIPIKKIFRKGIDYKHNIDVYDETNRHARNMMLEHYVGTSAYELVRYSSPNGTIRVKGLKNFTHFVCAGFGDSNTPRVYRVVTYRTVGDGIVEYDFVLDYYKDYFQHYDINDSNDFRVKMTTDKNYWYKCLARGDEPLDGTVDYVKEIFSDKIQDNPYHWAVSGMLSGHAIATYMLNDSQLLALYNTLLSSEKSEKYASLIYRIEFVSYEFTELAHTTEEALTIDGDTVIDLCERLLPYDSSHSPYVVRYQLFDGPPPQIFADGIEFSAPSVLYVQGYGTTQLTPFLKRYLQEKHEAGEHIKIWLLENINTGVTTLQIDDITDFETSANQTVPIPSNAAPQTIRQYGADAIQTVGAASLGGALGGLKMGGPTAAVALGLAGFATATIKSYFGLESILQTVGPKMSTGSNSASNYTGIFVISYNPVSVELEEFYDKVGYPTDIRALAMVGWNSGGKYDVFMLDAVRGVDEYADAAKTAIERDYMIYNYNTAAGV